MAEYVSHYGIASHTLLLIFFFPWVWKYQPVFTWVRVHILDSISRNVTARLSNLCYILCVISGFSFSISNDTTQTEPTNQQRIFFLLTLFYKSNSHRIISRKKWETEGDKMNRYQPVDQLFNKVTCLTKESGSGKATWPFYSCSHTGCLILYQNLKQKQSMTVKIIPPFSLGHQNSD